MAEPYYDIALFFPSHVTLKGLYELLNKLDENEIDVDYATLDFQDDGLYCEAKTYNEDAEEIIKNIGNGDVMLDWDTMSEWVDEENDC